VLAGGTPATKPVPLIVIREASCERVAALAVTVGAAIRPGRVTVRFFQMLPDRPYPVRLAARMAFAPAATPAKASAATIGALPTNLTLVSEALLPNALSPREVTPLPIFALSRPGIPQMPCRPPE